MSKQRNKNKPVKKDYSSLFTDKFLLALANWQRGWSENQEKRRVIADVLVEQCLSLPCKFKHVNKICYRKRFLTGVEAVTVVLEDCLYEGIASWSTELDYVKDFKGLYREGTKFTVVFEHKPKKDEVVVSLIVLWKNKDFIKAVEKFNIQFPYEAKPLMNFKDKQFEIVLKSTLKGSGITDIVGVSHSFDELCDMANIPDEERELLSKEYAKDLQAIPIDMPTFVGRGGARKSIKKVITEMKAIIEDANLRNVPVIWPERFVHEDDLKHHSK